MSDTPKLYKVLVNGKSCHGGKMTWSLPNGKPGKWHRFQGEPVICQSGFHLTTEPFRWYKLDCECYLSEAKEVLAWENDKCVAKSVRLLEKVQHPEWWIEAMDFIAALKSIPWCQPQGEPLTEWEVSQGANLAAAWDAAGAAARAAAWDAAGAAARAAARAAAWDAARAATRAATWAAAGDALEPTVLALQEAGHDLYGRMIRAEAPPAQWPAVVIAEVPS